MLFDSYGEYVFLDGAMGTMLQSLLKLDFSSGIKPDILNITEPQAVEKIHRMYVEAGSDIISTNTFGANAEMLRGTGYSPHDIISAAVALAKRAAAGIGDCIISPPGNTKVSLSIGPTGKLLEPIGDFEIETAYGLFREMAIAGESSGADLITIETMSDLTEAETALRAVKENTSLPIFVTMTFEKSGHSFMGCAVEKFAASMQSLGADAIGMNCSFMPSDMYAVAERLSAAASLPLIIKLNAGLPDSKTGIYSVPPETFAAQMLPYKKLGIKLIGGCCGTTPEYIKELRKAFQERS